MTKLASLLLAGAMFMAAAPQTFTGVITCDMCKKDHSMMGVKPDAKCVIECTKGGHSKLGLLVGDKFYVLSDQAGPVKFAAKKVKVTGTLFEKTQILKVDSIAEAK
jgi:hypothetical protein